ncbi:MAG: restriction endonuclease subunit S [Firmicutes bacterium]|nr:restriction endonuclease subunit S [Bacillota bacterium]
MGKPKIRFKGFDNDWEQRKLGDIADVTKLAGFEFTEHVVYSDEGNTIALRGLNIKNGQLILDDVKYIDGSNFSKLSRSKLFIDDIMFTYVGTVGEVAIIKENDRFYLAPNVSRIRVKSDDSPKFISHYMRTDNFKNKVIFPLIATSSQPALSMENIRKFTINIPINREEQDCLAKYFDNLDHLITLHQRKCEDTKKLKKYMLQKMFPQNGSKVPEIRFKGFTDDWEQRKLGDEAIEMLAGGDIDKSRVVENGKYPIYANALTNDGIVGYYDDYYRVKAPAVTVTGRGDVGHAQARTVDFTPVVRLLAIRSEHDAYFLENAINNHGVIVESTGVPQLTVPQLENYMIQFPRTIEEETKIGDYFRNLDHLITLHQNKCDELKKIKKYMLQNMFV